MVSPVEEEDTSPPEEARKETLVGPLPPVIKEEPDVKPRRLHTTYLGPLLKWAGIGNEEHIITKVIQGNDPFVDYYEDSKETRGDRDRRKLG